SEPLTLEKAWLSSNQRKKLHCSGRLYSHGEVPANVHRGSGHRAPIRTAPYFAGTVQHSSAVPRDNHVVSIFPNRKIWKRILQIANAEHHQAIIRVIRHDF